MVTAIENQVPASARGNKELRVLPHQKTQEELRTEIFTALFSADKRQVRMTARDREFWAQFPSPPDELRVATSSIRKAFILFWELCLLNGIQLPKVLTDCRNDTEKIFKMIGTALPNKNGELTKNGFVIGHIHGKPVRILLSEGEEVTRDDLFATRRKAFESNFEGTPQELAFALAGFEPPPQLQAYYKAAWAARHNTPAASEAENNQNYWFVGLDTVAYSRPDNPTANQSQLGKPSSIPGFEESDPKAFFERYVEAFFSEPGVLNGVTAIVIVNSMGEIMAEHTTANEVSVDGNVVLANLGELQPNISAGGVLQVMTNYRTLHQNVELANSYFDRSLRYSEATVMKLKVISHISGAPLDGIMHCLFSLQHPDGENVPSTRSMIKLPTRQSGRARVPAD